MPFMHSESLNIHDTAMELFNIDGLELQFEYEKEHREVLLQFGRYPTRNEQLNRVSTAEEQAYLDSLTEDAVV